LTVSAAWKAELQTQVPELPQAKKERFMQQYGLPAYDAGLLVSSAALADYYEQVVRGGVPGKAAANWVLTELTYLLKEADQDISDSPVSAGHLCELVLLIEKGTVSGKMAKDILAEMFKSGKLAGEVIAAQGLEQITDPEKIAAVARQVIRDNPKQTEQYQKGKTATLGWFVGQVMRATRGQAHPQKVQEILKQELAN
jgi:aspartyl-tRNA(Asn)/glutamyl-tRNA(Gln) amidotransferase subunit B